MAAGSILIELLLKTGSFVTDTLRAGKSLKTLKKEAEDAGKAIGFAFGIAQTALVAFAKAQVNALDALNDASDATGATVENLSALEDVARRNGGTLEEVTGTVLKFQKALSEADGKNAVSRALQGIGLDVQKLKQLDPAEALLEYAKALDKVGADGEAARQVQVLFGKSVGASAPFLKDLAEAGVLNAKVTTAQAKEAEAFNKQLFAMQKNAADAARTILSDLLPAVNSLLRDVSQGNFADKFFGTLGLGTSTAAEALVGKLTKVNDAIGETQQKINEIQSRGSVGDTFLSKGGVAAIGDAIGRLAGDDLPTLQKRLAELRGESAATERQMAALAKVSEGFKPDKPDAKKPPITPLTPDGGTNPFDALIKSAREQLALAKAQGEAEDDLTQAMQARVKIQADLDAGTLKLTKKEKDLLFGILGETDALQKSNEEKKKAAELSKQITEQLQGENDRRLENQRQIRDSLEQEAKAAQEQAAAYGLSAEAVEALAIARERERANKLDARAQAESNALLDEEAAITRDQAKAIRAVADARQSVLDKNIALQNDPLTGATQGVKDYLTEIGRAGDETRRITEGALHGLEDVLTSKDPVKAARALVSQLIAEFYRLLVIKPLMQSITGGSGGLEGLLKLFGSGSGNLQLGGAGGTTITPQLVGEFATGTPYIPKTGLALVHEGERVLTRKQNAEGWGRGGVTVNKVPANYEVETTQGSDGQLVLTMQRVANAAIDRAMKPGGRGRTGLRAQAPDRR
jgi:hypothetical protein